MCIRDRFKGVPNFGDRISADIVAAVSGAPVRHADHPSADLFAIGSIMSRVAKAVRRSDAPVGPCVWGTGVKMCIRDSLKSLA